MKSIYEKQIQIQTTFCKKRDKPSPINFNGYFSKKTVLDFIHEHAYFLGQEVDEILAEVAGSRDRVKPWNKDYANNEHEIFITTDKIKDEAMDMLAFAMNILMACGVTPENIEECYEKTYKKVTGRQEKM